MPANISLLYCVRKRKYPYCTAADIDVAAVVATTFMGCKKDVKKDAKTLQESVDKGQYNVLL